MSDLAAELDVLPAIRGYAVYDAAFRCLGHRLHGDLDPDTLMQTLLQLQTAFDTFASAHGGIEHGVITFVAECSSGSLALRRIGGYQVAALLDAGADPAPLVEALDEFARSLSGDGERHSLEDSLGNLISDDDLDASSSLEFYSASLETPAEEDLVEEPPWEKEPPRDSLWDKGVKEFVGKIGKKKKE